MRMVSIASGSSGNCIYIGSDNTHVLVDAGISNKRIEMGLNDLGLNARELDGILITHEHSDHIKGLGVLARKYGTPIYSTKETLEEIQDSKSLGEIPEDLMHPITPDVDFMVGDLEVKPFRIDHDAANPVAYRVDHLQGLDAILLEANHDVKMLEAGPYPYYLKRRILGDYGHLSNENAGRLLSSILHDNLKHIFLGHLSKENNYEELAYETVRLEITEGDTPYKANDFPITVAKRNAVSQIVTV
mgnify:CR=1 FL=1